MSTPEAVLQFYRELPFNFRSSAREAASKIQRENTIERGYPILVPLLQKGRSVLDVGCGAGWFSLNAAYHLGCAVTGIDFNEVALERGRQVARELGVSVSFQEADVFTYIPPQSFDVVASIGVLHHTKDCIEALSRVCSFARPGGHVFVGLYHAHGRKPFLKHFKRLQSDGASEDEMLAEYARLHPLADKVHLRSWFRDQVLHPHETQHTLAEILPVLRQNNVELIATSINAFATIRSIDEVIRQEASLEHYGAEQLAKGRYYPGFFIVLGRVTG